ncbi:S8 family serine peptidase [uncultured Roseivirga sp.]|uniref:S8 family serine peptidase n=1 Tax=uncultured Roseivirga sp. TaxID=543088 RepID=UPI0030D84E24|tara:strand:- start:177278 stop:178882 length:1605 start_codon:yes stop_codon:yes gene_type:complete
MKIKASLIVLFIIIGFRLSAQNRYMVFFTDKSNSSYSVNAPSAFLSQRAIERRQKQNIPILENDLPVNQSYIDALNNLGIEAIHRSKWFNGVLVEMQPASINLVQALTFVERVEYVAPGQIPAGNAGGSENNSKLSNGGATDFQNSMLGIDQMHNEGFEGQGMLIGVFDGGFQNMSQIGALQPLITSNRILAQKNYVTNGTNIENTESHGTRVLSILAADQPNVYVGAAPAASYILCVTEASGEYRVEEYNWLFAAEMADSTGVDIINTSLGYSIFDNATMSYTYSDMDGQTAVITKASNIAATKGIALINSAGNEGSKVWRFITAPSDSENVLSVGAVDASGFRADFSSFGPSADNRIKPDVSALGQGTAVITASGNIAFQNGTSFSGPVLAGFATCLWQAFPDLNNIELLDLIRQSAHQFDNPDNELGYGIPNYRRAYELAFMPEPLENEVLAYPNPTSDNFINLVFPDGFLSESVEVSLIDVNGRQLNSFKIESQLSNSRIQIDLTNRIAGIYILKIEGQRTSFKKKIIKY